MSNNLNLLGLTACQNQLSTHGMTADSVERMIDLYHKRKMLKKDGSESKTKPVVDDIFVPLIR